MKRIGNFLFIEQWFNDHEPEQAIVNINSIKCIVANELSDCRQHTIIEMNRAKIALTSNHDDNIIELSQLLADNEPINLKWEDDV